MKTTIPFQGFYYSVHDGIFDHAIELLSENSKDDYSTFTDWDEVRLGYAKKYLTAFSEFTGIEVTFDILESPKYYNYKTDRIHADISEEEVERIYNETGTETLKKVIKENFTSCSGFISHYPNTLDRWPTDLKEWDCNHVGTLLLAYLTDKDLLKDLDYKLIEGADLNETAYNLIADNFNKEVSDNYSAD